MQISHVIIIYDIIETKNSQYYNYVNNLIKMYYN